MVWYSHLFKNFSVFVIHTVKGFSIVSEVEIDVFLDLSCFFDDPADVGNLLWFLRLFKTQFVGSGVENQIIGISLRHPTEMSIDR